MDNPAIVDEIYEIAKLAAAKQVKPEHWLGALPHFLAAPAAPGTGKGARALTQVQALFLCSRTSFTLLKAMPGLCWPV